MRVRNWIVLMLLTAATSFATPVFAEQHIADQTAMQQAVREAQSADQNNRAAVIEALGREDVRQLADKFGLDLKDAAAAVSTLSGAQLAELAEPARAINADQTGGAQTVVISITTLLLIIIIVLLVAD